MITVQTYDIVVTNMHSVSEYIMYFWHDINILWREIEPDVI